MKLVDANVLLYADDRDATHHREARKWLHDALKASEPLIIPWMSILAYLRIATHPRLHQHPRTPASASAFIRAMLTGTSAVHGDPDHRHLERVADLLAATGVGGNLVNDAHLAALALQYDAIVISYDNDFGRFPGVRWQRPSALDV